MKTHIKRDTLYSIIGIDDTIHRVQQPHTFKVLTKADIHALTEYLAEMIRRHTRLAATSRSVM